MITPDTKDWTWVLDRTCPECGLDASVVQASTVPSHLRANAATWEALLAADRIRPGRPDPSRWSSLEYACHVRDVFVRFDARVALMLSEDDPHFENWDQDASAANNRYDQQDPTAVISQLAESAEALAARLDGVSGADWLRPGRRSDGASFTVESIARYMIHDPVHHLWDVNRSSE